MVYDVAIIGAGAVGALTARELSRYKTKICVLERSSDIASGSTKANSGIVHAGYDPMPGTLKAVLNVKGNLMFDRISEELDIPFKRTGSLVLAFSDEDMSIIRGLCKRGLQNGVHGLRILESPDEIAGIEPNASPVAIGALYAPSAGITCPFELAYGAIDNAVENGVSLMLETEVKNIREENGVFVLDTNNGPVRGRYIVNAAGLYADRISEMAGDGHFAIRPRKGEYLLLDKNQGERVKTVLFRTPSDAGKGVLVTPTVDGNLLVGPNSAGMEDKEDTSTTAAGMEQVIRDALKLAPGIDMKQVITSFAGLRATPSTDDFIISPSRKTARFINAAGIESPGLTAAPAIAEYVADLLKDAGLELAPREDFKPFRRSIERFGKATDGEKAEMIRRNRLYGNVVCRCELVTEAEIVESARRPAGARNMDAVKRRTRAGMGRCQGGFCTPRILRILSRELGIPMQEVTKKGGASTLLAGETKEAL